MAKILLVEDDNNLREIYEARLQAEGYDIVSAKDGEEALVVAKKEQPDLIIADVMMPRVSGFEMLDIIRNTPELKDVHVIMLTALGQAEDKTRADSLGADRYLVKSQVTLEDIVKAAADVLAGAPTTTPVMAAAATEGTQPPAAVSMPVVSAPPTAPPAPPVTPPVGASDVNTPVVGSAPEPNLAAPQQIPTPSVSLPVATPPADVATPATTTAPPAQPQGAPTVPPTAPPGQPAAAQAIPEPSATDSQLVSDAVNNLVAGANDTPTPARARQTQSTPPVPIQPQPAPPMAVPLSTATAQPQAPLTMQPILAPPVAPAPAQTPTPAPSVPDTSTSGYIPPSARKAIQPPPPGSTSGPSDLNELMVKEGHSMDAEVPQIFDGTHMPGNVISPGTQDSGAGQPPATSNPSDPNSISL